MLRASFCLTEPTAGGRRRGGAATWWATFLSAIRSIGRAVCVCGLGARSKARGGVRWSAELRRVAGWRGWLCGEAPPLASTAPRPSSLPQFDSRGGRHCLAVFRFALCALRFPLSAHRAHAVPLAPFSRLLRVLRVTPHSPPCASWCQHGPGRRPAQQFQPALRFPGRSWVVESESERLRVSSCGPRLHKGLSRRRRTCRRPDRSCTDNAFLSAAVLAAGDHHHPPPLARLVTALVHCSVPCGFSACAFPAATCRSAVQHTNQRVPSANEVRGNLACLSSRPK